MMRYHWLTKPVRLKAIAIKGAVGPDVARERTVTICCSMSGLKRHVPNVPRITRGRDELESKRRKDTVDSLGIATPPDGRLLVPPHVNVLYSDT